MSRQYFRPWLWSIFQLEHDLETNVKRIQWMKTSWLRSKSLSGPFVRNPWRHWSETETNPISTKLRFRLNQKSRFFSLLWEGAKATIWCLQYIETGVEENNLIHWLKIEPVLNGPWPHCRRISRHWQWMDSSWLQLQVDRSHNFPAKMRKRKIVDHSCNLSPLKQMIWEATPRGYNYQIYKYKLRNRCNWFECCWASNPDRDACPESPPEWNGLIWELQIRPGFTACAPPLPTSQCKKLEISNAPLVFFIWGFQAIYWGDRFLKLITTRWGHLRAKEHCNTVTWFWQNRKRKLPGWFQ